MGWISGSGLRVCGAGLDQEVVADLEEEHLEYQRVLVPGKDAGGGYCKARTTFPRNTLSISEFSYMPLDNPGAPYSNPGFFISGS